MWTCLCSIMNGMVGDWLGYWEQNFVPLISLEHRRDREMDGMIELSREKPLLEWGNIRILIEMRPCFNKYQHLIRA